MHRTTLIHTDTLTPDQRARLQSLGSLTSRGDHFLLRHQTPLDPEALAGELGCDVNTLPPDFDPERVRLVVSDLDSTLIGIETIDELAAELDLKERVAAITERAMAGELDFTAALRERVALLEGLARERLEQVFATRMLPAIQPGARETLAWLKRKGITFAVVSGGFTFFLERLQRHLPIDDFRACRLEIRDGRLTGQVIPPVVDKHVKAAYVEELRRRLGLSPQQVVAVGDGANDVPMLRQAGLGIAYHGHPIARAHADVRIDYGDWHTLRQLLTP
ncbi:phosphoserine phosphatase [Methylomarinovum tepidoasis]|uniref:Phosphoserine phosphatase n=1 Tax=Methylomarinovum tepidoasis TaxID=2840183 RepID=A0AAU9C407_9GAMM|nr:phosphoserine phosphatase SerB [Methylomarinovum sp. IN45]BCX88197.1 phosphoserine phosphatase [Methylomarinovum sp. IN45]